ncbi:MAG TPA: hypothetical protein VNJ70_15710 [Thermoanaerobaculia bacterium]|nr:hypothetical protein [Thermoanaerobaculia bacterium]
MPCDESHFLLWQRSEEVKDSDVSVFRRSAGFDSVRLNHFTNRVDGARFWSIEVSDARTINPIANTTKPGQLTDRSKFVCGFFVIKGNVDSVVKRSNQIDRSFAEKFLPSLTGAALDDFSAHATATYAAVSGIDASIMTFWANNYSGEPRMPTDLAIGAIVAYNEWGRRLVEEGYLLDAGRMNVRHGASHMIGDEVFDGPFSGLRLVGLGSYPGRERFPIEAIRESGLLSNDRSLVMSLQKCNGWCKALSNEPPFFDNPKNEIFV